jgi:hypothetical protein
VDARGSALEARIIKEEEEDEDEDEDEDEEEDPYEEAKEAEAEEEEGLGRRVQHAQSLGASFDGRVEAGSRAVAAAVAASVAASAARGAALPAAAAAARSPPPLALPPSTVRPPDRMYRVDQAPGDPRRPPLQQHPWGFIPPLGRAV